MKDIEIWRRFAFFSGEHPPGQADGVLYVPMIEPVGSLPYELAGLLPNREHNRDLMALINDLPENRAGRRSLIGVFAADPFLNCKQIAARLLAKGYRQVTNIPPVAGYGAEFLATLDKVSSGGVQEQRNLGQLAAHGLSICPAVAANEGLPAALAWAPSMLWVVPSFDMWQGTGINAELLLSLCRDAAGRTDVPIVLVAGGTGISASEAAEAGAGGLLLD